MSLQAQMEKLRVRQAAEWYQVNRSGEASDEDRQQFAAWLGESPLNNAAYFKIVALSRATRVAAREAGLDGLALVKELTPSLLPIAESQPPAGSTRRKLPRWTLTFAVAAAALASVALFIATGLLETKRYTTGTAEERTITLDDGSMIYLNAKSSARVRFSRAQRDIDLMGEAFFQVAHDAGRPFKVHTPEAVVRAVGTAFNVSTRSDGTRVAVTEGKVQVSQGETLKPGTTAGPSAPASAQPLALKAGEIARISPAGAIERRPSSEVVNALAWREHLVIIDGMALEQAVEEFNKYRRAGRLRLEDVTPGAHHYSGTFYANDPNSFVEFLSHERDLTVEKDGDEIVIRERQ